MTLRVATSILPGTVQLYRTISKFHYKQQSYSLEVNLLQGLPVTLTLKVVTQILRTTLCLVMTLICAKQYFNPTTNNKVMALSAN